MNTEIENIIRDHDYSELNSEQLTAINSDVTLVGFARNGRQTIYSHKERILLEGDAL